MENYFAELDQAVIDAVEILHERYGMALLETTVREFLTNQIVSVDSRLIELERRYTQFATFKEKNEYYHTVLIPRREAGALIQKDASTALKDLHVRPYEEWADDLVLRDITARGFKKEIDHWTMLGITYKK